jgi:hypothetical protein
LDSSKEGVNWKLSPVRQDRKKSAEDRSNPVNPVVAWEAAIDDSRSKGTGWIHAGCSKLSVSKRFLQ